MARRKQVRRKGLNFLTVLVISIGLVAGLVLGSHIYNQNQGEVASATSSRPRLFAMYSNQFQYTTQYPGEYKTQYAGQYAGEYKGQYGTQYITQYSGQYAAQTPTYKAQYSSQYRTQYTGQYGSQYPSQYRSQYSIQYTRNKCDVDNNGRINGNDKDAIQQCIRGVRACTSGNKSRSDINGDRRVNDTDVQVFSKYCLALR